MNAHCDQRKCWATCIPSDDGHPACSNDALAPGAFAGPPGQPHRCAYNPSRSALPAPLQRPSAASRTTRDARHVAPDCTDATGAAAASPAEASRYGIGTLRKFDASWRIGRSPTRCCGGTAQDRDIDSNRGATVHAPPDRRAGRAFRPPGSCVGPRRLRPPATACNAGWFFAVLCTFPPRHWAG